MTRRGRNLEYLGSFNNNSLILSIHPLKGRRIITITEKRPTRGASQAWPKRVLGYSTNIIVINI